MRNIFREEISYLKRKNEGNPKELLSQIEKLQFDFDRSQEENSNLRAENSLCKKSKRKQKLLR